MLAEEMGTESVAGGTFVFREGDESARIHVVRTGGVELGRMLGGRPEPFDARASEDSTLLSRQV